MMTMDDKRISSNDEFNRLCGVEHRIRNLKRLVKKYKSTENLCGLLTSNMIHKYDKNETTLISRLSRD